MDETEFEQLCSTHWQPVLHYALRRAASAADAADVVAETFVVAWRRREQVPAGEDTGPWLFGVARHVLANQRRGLVRRSKLHDRILSATLTAYGTDPSEVVVGDEASRAIRRALGSLSDVDRELLTLTAWDGLSPSQAAVVLGISGPTARVRLHRARQRLKAHLPTDPPDPPPLESSARSLPIIEALEQP